MQTNYEMNLLGLKKGYVFTIRKSKRKGTEILFRKEGGTTEFETGGILRQYFKMAQRNGVTFICEAQAIENITKAEYEASVKILLIDYTHRIFKAGDYNFCELNPILYRLISLGCCDKRLEDFLCIFNYSGYNFKIPNFVTEPKFITKKN